jgi:hypothetical protein
MAAVGNPAVTLDVAKLLVAAKADLAAKNRCGVQLRARPTFPDLLVNSLSAFAYVAGLATMPFMLPNLVMELTKWRRTC